MRKKRNIEEKTYEKKYLKGNLVQTSDYETDDEEDVIDIMHTVRRKVGGKIILVNIHSAPMDNESFYSETSVHKCKYVSKRRIAC